MSTRTHHRFLPDTAGTRPAHAVFLDAASLGADVDLSGLSAACQSLRCLAHTAADDVVAQLADANVAICNKTPIDADVLKALPSLALVLVTATGVNNIDLEAAAAHGVEVRNCRAYGTPAVAQHTMMLILTLATRFLDYQRDMAEGRWQRADTFCLMDRPIIEVSGLTLGIFGRGSIGSAVAELGRAFGMTVQFAQLPGRPQRADRVPWMQLLREADVVSLNCPLNPTTRHLIDAQALAVMKRDALLVNTARADLVDAQALVFALRNGRLGGAAFDGLDVEPPRDGHVLLDTGVPNLVVTPHNAWASRQARQRLVNQTVENLQAWQRADVLRRVVPGV